MIAALVLGACAANPSIERDLVRAPTSVTQPTGPMLVSGLRVPAPVGANWSMARNTSNAVVFSRPGTNPEHRWAAWVQAVRSPQPIDGYFQLARVVDRLSQPRSSGRFRDSFEPVDAAYAPQARCLARSSRIADYGPPPQAEAPRHIVRAREFFCAHPNDPRLLVLVHVSERDAPDAPFATLAATADQFFSAIGF